MKQLFFIMCFFVCSHVFSQAGIYVIDHTHDSSDVTKLKWKLTLNSDKTFLYHFYRDIVGEMNPEENFYGKGTWKAEGNLVFFYTDKKIDIDKTYKINFTNSKARYITKLPRDKSDKIVKTALRFYNHTYFI